MKSPNRALSTESVGWNGSAFVLPDECIGGNTDETLLLQNASQDHSFKQSGTLEEWKQNVAQPRCWKQQTRAGDVHGLRGSAAGAVL